MTLLRSKMTAALGAVASSLAAASLLEDRLKQAKHRAKHELGCSTSLYHESGHLLDDRSGKKLVGLAQRLV